MTTIATRVFFDFDERSVRMFRNDVLKNGIKKFVARIFEARRCRAEYRRLLEHPDWVFEDVGLTRAQVEEAAKNNHVTSEGPYQRIERTPSDTWEPRWHGHWRTLKFL